MRGVKWAMVRLVLIGIAAQVCGSFAGQASATGTLTPPPLVSFLDEEAGMSIYTNVSAPLDLSRVKPVFKIIEKEGPAYVIGSVSLPGLPATDDVHCFVHKDGWVLVYYLKADPVSKILRLGEVDKLRLGLEKVCKAIGVLEITAKYYHFQYPYANKWMIIVQSVRAPGWDWYGEDFNIMIPGTFAIYERSYVMFGERCSFSIGGRQIREGPGYGWVPTGMLGPDVFHTVSVGAARNTTTTLLLVLVYREP